MTVFSFALVFCAGVCAGISGLVLYLNRMEEEDDAETRQS